MTSTSVRFRILLPIAFAAACSEPAAAPPSFTARDSAGVRIVEHASFEELPLRGAADAPVVTIGTAVADETQQLDRVMGGSVLGDGRIVLLNSGTSELRFYDGSGTLVATQGRPGDGPGEYRGAFYLFPMAGDSLLVWDLGPGRGTVVGPDAAVERTITLESDRPLIPAGVFPGGELLVIRRVSGFSPNEIRLTAVDRHFDHRYSAEGRPLAELGERPAPTIMLYRGIVPATGSPDPTLSYNMGPVPLAASTQRAIAGDGYWTGSQQAREIVFRDRAGAPRTLVRWQGPPLTVTDADKGAYVESRIAAARDEETRMALRTTELEAFNFPAELPSHGALVAATDGALWMADYARPGETGPARWTVIAADGTVRERVELPEGSTLLWASDDRVLLRLEDELGVQRVELRGLEAPPAGP